MSVSGALTTMSLPEILQWLQYSQKTGTVMFENRSVVKKVYVERGLIVSASSNDPREYLGQILICFGLLTEQQLTEAFKVQKTKKTLLGKVLREDFGIDEVQILKSLRIKIEETVYDIFLWDEGRFVYSEGISGLLDHDRLDTAIPVEQVLFEGARRVDEWREFRNQIPDDHIVFFKEKKDPVDLIKDPIVGRIYKDIDGKKSIQRVLLDSHAPQYRGYEAFAKLFWGGFIKADLGKRKKPKVKEADLQSDLLKAAELLKSKNFDESYDLLEGFLGTQPNHVEAQTLFRAVKEAYLKSLYHLAPPTSIPVLTMDFSQLNEKVYSSKEGYLASRVNGEWDVKSLIMISPLGEMESLRILKRLYDGGMLKFEERQKA